MKALNSHGNDNFVLSEQGHSGTLVFLGNNNVFKYCPDHINEWQKKSFNNEKNTLKQLEKYNFNVVIPKIVEEKFNIDSEKGFFQTKVDGQSLSEIIKNDYVRGMDIIRSTEFIHQIAQFIIDFDKNLSNTELMPLKENPFSLITEENLSQLKHYSKKLYELFNTLKREESSHRIWFHNDLNYENIFVSKDGAISVIDFGEATITSPEKSCGKLFYSMNLNNRMNNSTHSAWNICRRIHELDNRYPTPEQAILFGILPAINTFEFKVNSHNIITLVKELEQYLQLLNEKRLENIVQQNIDDIRVKLDNSSQTVNKL